MIEEATHEVGGKPSDLCEVVVNVGPGFTGVRTAVATAAMLGRLGAQVLALPAHLAVAEASLADGSAQASIVLAVKNHRAWIGTVHWQDGRWTASGSCRRMWNLKPSSLNTNQPGLWRMRIFLKNFRVGAKSFRCGPAARALLKRLERHFTNLFGRASAHLSPSSRSGPPLGRTTPGLVISSHCPTRKAESAGQRSLSLRHR